MVTRTSSTGNNSPPPTFFHVPKTRFPSSLYQYILEFLHAPFVNKVTTLEQDKEPKMYRDTACFSPVCREWNTETNKYYASRNNHYRTIFPTLPTTPLMTARAYQLAVLNVHNTFVPLPLDQVHALSDSQLIDYVNRLSYLNKKTETLKLLTNENILHRIKNRIPYLHLVSQRVLVWRAFELADLELLSSLKIENIGAFLWEDSNPSLIKFLTKSSLPEEQIIKILDWYKNQPELLPHLSNGPVVINISPHGKLCKPLFTWIVAPGSDFRQHQSALLQTLHRS